MQPADVLSRKVWEQNKSVASANRIAVGITISGGAGGAVLRVQQQWAPTDRLFGAEKNYPVGQARKRHDRSQTFNSWQHRRWPLHAKMRPNLWQRMSF